MALFSKKADPITARAKRLNQQIAALEQEIQQLNSKIQAPASLAPARNSYSTSPSAPRSTLVPQNASEATTNQPSRSLPTREPIFESVAHEAPASDNHDKAHFNDLGVRKYDIMAAWRRLQRIARGPSAHNAKLVSYLAAGSIRGLRPLRYEKRIARNRFIALTLFFLILLRILIGLFWR